MTDSLTSDEIPTPRTDAQIRYAPQLGVSGMVPTDFARQLERENAALVKAAKRVCREMCQTDADAPSYEAIAELESAIQKAQP